MMNKFIFLLALPLLVLVGYAKPSQETPRIVAHRGLSATYPENTLPSFERAIELEGIFSVEFDIRLTLDGKLVLIHDKTLERCSNGSGAVRDKTLAELKKLDFGGWKDKRFAGTKIPELNEFLDLVEKRRPRLFLSVEIKENDPECAIAILTELKRRNLLNNCSIISFYPEMLRVAWEFDNSLLLHGFEPHKLESKIKEDEKEAYFRMIKKIGIPLKELTPEKVSMYHKRGIKVDTWAVDDKESWEYAVYCGVDFVTTNKADDIVELK